MAQPRPSASSSSSTAAVARPAKRKLVRGALAARPVSQLSSCPHGAQNVGETFAKALSRGPVPPSSLSKNGSARLPTQPPARVSPSTIPAAAAAAAAVATHTNGRAAATTTTESARRKERVATPAVATPAQRDTPVAHVRRPSVTTAPPVADFGEELGRLGAACTALVESLRALSASDEPLKKSEKHIEALLSQAATKVQAHCVAMTMGGDALRGIFNRVTTSDEARRDAHFADLVRFTRGEHAADAAPLAHVDTSRHIDDVAAAVRGTLDEALRVVQKAAHTTTQLSRRCHGHKSDYKQLLIDAMALNHELEGERARREHEHRLEQQRREHAAMIEQIRLSFYAAPSPNSGDGDDNGAANASLVDISDDDGNDNNGNPAARYPPPPTNGDDGDRSGIVYEEYDAPMVEIPETPPPTDVSATVVWPFPDAGAAPGGGEPNDAEGEEPLPPQQSTPRRSSMGEADPLAGVPSPAYSPVVKKRRPNLRLGSSPTGAAIDSSVSAATPPAVVLPLAATSVENCVAAQVRAAARRESLAPATRDVTVVVSAQDDRTVVAPEQRPPPPPPQRQKATTAPSTPPTPRRTSSEGGKAPGGGSGTKKAAPVDQALLRVYSRSGYSPGDLFLGEEVRPTGSRAKTKRYMFIRREATLDLEHLVRNNVPADRTRETGTFLAMLRRQGAEEAVRYFGLLEESRPLHGQALFNAVFVFTRLVLATDELDAETAATLPDTPASRTARSVATALVKYLGPSALFSQDDSTDPPTVKPRTLKGNGPMENYRKHVNSASERNGEIKFQSAWNNTGEICAELRGLRGLAEADGESVTGICWYYVAALLTLLEHIMEAESDDDDVSRGSGGNVPVAPAAEAAAATATAETAKQSKKKKKKAPEPAALPQQAQAEQARNKKSTTGAAVAAGRKRPREEADDAGEAARGPPRKKPRPSSSSSPAPRPTPAAQKRPATPTHAPAAKRPRTQPPPPVASVPPTPPPPTLPFSDLDAAVDEVDDIHIGVPALLLDGDDDDNEPSGTSGRRRSMSLHNPLSFLHSPNVSGHDLLVAAPATDATMSIDRELSSARRREADLARGTAGPTAVAMNFDMRSPLPAMGDDHDIFGFGDGPTDVLETLRSSVAETLDAAHGSNNSRPR